jgi:TRAP-type mannitol/chloroaromatic compound transport system permease small subunit
MPNLNFILPLWLYWAILLFFPLVAMVLVRHQRKRPTRGPTLFIAYLFWLCSGFLGIHRFYLRSAIGFGFIAVFLGLLYCNTQVHDYREPVSRTFAALERLHREAEIAPQGQPGAELVARLEQGEHDLALAQADYDSWVGRTRLVAGTLGLALLVDAALLPGLIRRRRERETMEPALEVEHPLPQVRIIGTGEDPTRVVHSPVTDVIEWINVHIGEYVSYWAVIAVFAYYYEVLARYVFNSPTNWVHESMFLMFGMQYLLAGAFAYREDQHVRVDVLYTRFSPRGKAIADLVTSIFFFIFAGTMLWTGARFALDAISYDEHSFTEWGVQYWPVKLAIPVGAALILLQGLSKLIKDVLIVFGKRGRNGP